MAELIRLNKRIAALGICSRRKADDYIREGIVFVNNEVVTDLGTKVDPDVDIIRVEGVHVPSKEKNQTLVYITLNKPIDYISSTTSEQGASVLDLITAENYYKPKYRDDTKKLTGVRLYPVGRLDKDSEGIVLLTNDGELTNQLTHPRYEHEKEYDVSVDKGLTPDVRKILSKGMRIEGEQYGGMKIKKEFNKGRRVILTLVLREGKNRHIRKMLGRLGYNISFLRRTRIEKLTLGTLPIGSWKFVKKTDIL